MNIEPASRLRFWSPLNTLICYVRRRSVTAVSLRRLEPHGAIKGRKMHTQEKENKRKEKKKKKKKKKQKKKKKTNFDTRAVRNSSKCLQRFLISCTHLQEDRHSNPRPPPPHHHHHHHYHHPLLPLPLRLSRARDVCQWVRGITQPRRNYVQSALVILD